MTVCPPWGSNTALNYDLLKAENKSLTEKDREDLKEEIYQMFLQSPHESHVSLMQALINPNNVDLVYQGFQSVPKPYGPDGFEILVRGVAGTIETPRFQDIYDESFHKDSKLYHLVLEIPDNLKDQLGRGTLVVELEVDTRQAEGWVEEVLYLEGHGYTNEADRSPRKWTEAQSQCKSQGKQLAKINSAWEQDQIDTIMDNTDEAWLGGSDTEDEGSWKWTDGSPISFSKWAPTLSTNNNGKRGQQGVGFDCILGTKTGHVGQVGSPTGISCCHLVWKDVRCTDPYKSICQAAPTVIQGQKKLVLKYTREQLVFSAFQVWYKLQAVNQNQLDGWKDKRMTGCRLSWRIENSALTLATSEIGRTIMTPQLGSAEYDKSYFEEDHSYSATLEFSKNLRNLVGQGFLVIQLDADMHDAEGWVETLTYSGESKQFKLIDGKKSWEEAEKVCQSEGGHLASVVSEEEKREVFLLAQGDEDDFLFLVYPDAQKVWIGGTDQVEEGSWRWSDHSSWMLAVDMTKKFGVNGDENDCMRVDGDTGDWRDGNCSEELAFICEQRTNVMTGVSSKTLTFKKEQLNMNSITVGYKYEAADRELLTSWKDQRMTGFTLNWFVQDSNGTLITEKLPHRPEDWKSTEVRIDPGYTDEIFNQSVLIAMQWRMQNITEEDMIGTIVEEKVVDYNVLESLDGPDYLGDSFCLETMEWPALPGRLGEMLDKLLGNETDGAITDEDIRVGFSIYSATVFCANTPKKLYTFFSNLVSTETPRTLLLALVNTIRSTSVHRSSDKTELNKLYDAIDEILQLSYGDLLLATSSKEDILTMLHNEWPFFTKYKAELEDCLRSNACQGVGDILKTQGKSSNLLNHFNSVDFR